MPNFILIPSRLIVGSAVGVGAVTSLNGLRGDLNLFAGNDLQLDISGKNLTMSVIPDTFIRKSGDIVPGNINFVPDMGGYGVALRTGVSDPDQYADGAIYVNTTDGALKVYLNGSWLTLGQTGALTQAEADARYLMLDASNGPLTGNLSMGTSNLQFGNKAEDPIGGSEGDVYFNTTNAELRLFAGGVWTNIGVGGGIGSLTAGTGLTATPENPLLGDGTLAVDEGYSFLWTGTHTHEQPIAFSTSQTFDIEKLTITDQQAGDILYYNGSTWTRLAAGAENTVLTVQEGVPSWDAPVGGTIGTPTDGTYTDGYFSDLTPGVTTQADFNDFVNEFLADIAPSMAGLLTGNALTATAAPTFYTARLSDGLGSEWYQDGKTAGSTISSYYLSGSLTLDSPSPTNTFRAGRKGDATTYGVVSHNIYNLASPSGIASAEVDLTTSPSIPAQSGTLTVTSHAIYNSVWMKANARIAYTQTADGYEGHTLSHTDAGETNAFKMWRDTWSNSNGTPAFSASPTAAEASPVWKYLSGIQYYGYNSTFQTRFAAASGIFRYCYNNSQVARIYGTGMNAVNLMPSSPPNYLDGYDRTGTNFELVTLDRSSEASPNKYLTVALFKAHGTTPGSAGTVVANASLSHAVCTYGTVSTLTSDIFMDEAQRLVLGASTAWDSTAALATGNAQQRITGTNTASLQYPDSSEYPGFTGDQEYQRYIYKTSASTGSLTFGNLPYTAISPYGSGDVNVLIYLDNDGKWFDLGVPQGSNGNNGSTRGAAISARANGSSGNTVQWSLGTYTTGPTNAGNLGRYRLVIIFRNSNRTITSISSS